MKESRERGIQDEMIIKGLIDYFYFMFEGSVGIINTSYNECMKL